MIAYLDGRALRRLYVQLEGSDDARRQVAEAAIVATSVVAYAEVQGAFAWLHQQGSVSAREHRSLRSELDRDWPHLLKLEVTEPVWRRAGDVAATYTLDGRQSLHIASFLVLAESNRGQTTQFWSPDERSRLTAKAALTAEA